ncbi:MAG TPA: FtsX-like permease family protein [Alphaproteobacteria bacterium]|nr:FtsX-like permease family protein [Alphaproteobacteria bacterium]
MMNPLPLLRAEWRRNPWGNLAIVLLIALAVALGVAVSAQERALRLGSGRAADRFDLLVGAPGSQTQLVLTGVYLQPAALPLLDGAVLQRLQADPGVAWLSPIAFGDFHQGHPVVGVTADFVTAGGRTALAEGRVFAAHGEAVVGADVPLALGAEFAPLHGANPAAAQIAGHAHGGHGYRVVGRLPRGGTPWDRAILAPVEAVWEVHGLPAGHADEARLGPPWDAPFVAPVPALVVKPKGVADAYRLRAAYRGKDSMALFPAEVMVELYRTLGDARDVLALVAVGTQVLVVAAVLLAVFATLAARRRQIAVLRALGATRGYVFLAVWLQVALLVGAGAGLGLLLGWGGALGLSAAMAARTGLALPVGLGGAEFAMAGALALAGSALAALPALAAFRRPPAAGLRQ